MDSEDIILILIVLLVIQAIGATLMKMQQLRKDTEAKYMLGQLAFGWEFLGVCM